MYSAARKRKPSRESPSERKTAKVVRLGDVLFQFLNNNAFEGNTPVVKEHDYPDLVEYCDAFVVKVLKGFMGDNHCPEYDFTIKECAEIQAKLLMKILEISENPRGTKLNASEVRTKLIQLCMAMEERGITGVHRLDGIFDERESKTRQFHLANYYKKYIPHMHQKSIDLSSTISNTEVRSILQHINGDVKRQ